MTISPAGTTSCGDPFFATVSVSANGKPGAAATVRLTASRKSAAEQTQTLTGTTDRAGPGDVDYTRDAPGIDTLVASVTLGSSTLNSEPIAHRWIRCGLALHLAPPGTTTAVNTEFAATVRVLDDGGRAVDQAAVKIVAAMEGQPDVIRELRTNKDGLATLRYTRTTPGEETISAAATSVGRRGQAAIAHTWADAGTPAVTLSPPGTSSSLGTSFTATALVTDRSTPVADTEVTLEATMPGQRTITQSSRTDENGLASITYTRSTAGMDTIAARATVGQRTVEAAIEHLWIDAPGLRMTLTPAGGASLTGTAFEVTASITVDGRPGVSQWVNFAASQLGQPDLTGRVVTNSEGSALLLHQEDRRPRRRCRFRNAEGWSTRAGVDGTSLAATRRRPLPTPGAAHFEGRGRFCVRFAALVYRLRLRLRVTSDAIH